MVLLYKKKERSIQPERYRSSHRFYAKYRQKNNYQKKKKQRQKEMHVGVNQRRQSMQKRKSRHTHTNASKCRQAQFKLYKIHFIFIIFRQSFCEVALFFVIFCPPINIRCQHDTKCPDEQSLCSSLDRWENNTYSSEILYAISIQLSSLQLHKKQQ